MFDALARPKPSSTNCAWYLCAPAPGTNSKVAVPELFSADEPRICISVQCGAEASQKLTCPAVTGVVPTLTCAVRSTAVPGVTLVTVDPPDVTLNVVDVAGRRPHNGIELEMLDS